MMRLAAALLALCCSAGMAAAGELPACDSASVLSTLSSRQAWAEAHTWKDGVTIAAVERVSERQLSVTEGLSSIDRRYCAAHAELTAAAPTMLYYVVSAGEGFAGYGWNVEFCLSGHDPYRVYGADCKILK